MRGGLCGWSSGSKKRVEGAKPGKYLEAVQRILLAVSRTVGSLLRVASERVGDRVFQFEMITLSTV